MLELLTFLDSQSVIIKRWVPLSSAWQWYGKHIGLAKITESLKLVGGPKIRCQIRFQGDQNPFAKLEGLKNGRSLPNHHSGPTVKISLIINGKDLARALVWGLPSYRFSQWVFTIQRAPKKKSLVGNVMDLQILLDDEENSSTSLEHQYLGRCRAEQ